VYQTIQELCRATPILLSWGTRRRKSPDGGWIAYFSNESGRFEIYVREFSLGSDGKPEATAKHQISTGGGVFPHWRDDGKESQQSSMKRPS
jgi:Tol biopolymer transport system component